MDHDQIFLSYSRNDLEAAANLRRQLERQGLTVFKDDKSIREGDPWLDRLQEAVDACSGFVVLVGRDGVGSWVGAETQTALSRYFGPHDDAERLPIFPLLLGEVGPDSLPAFLRLFQTTSWNGSDPLPERLLTQIRDRTIVNGETTFKGCPFVGLNAFRMNQAHLFFGCHKETLDALACFDTRPGSPTVRVDFLDHLEDLPRLVQVRNRFGRAWTLPPIDSEGLREVSSKVPHGSPTCT